MIVAVWNSPKKTFKFIDAVSPTIHHWCKASNSHTQSTDNISQNSSIRPWLHGIRDKFLKTPSRWRGTQQPQGSMAGHGEGTALSTAANVSVPLQQLGGEVLILKGFIIYISVPVSMSGIHDFCLVFCLIDCGVLVAFWCFVCLFVNYSLRKV